MEQSPTSTDLFQNNQQPQYGMLKTLTMLTFIGCALAYIFMIVDVATWGSYEKNLREAQEMEEKTSDETLARFSKGSVEMIERSHKYRYAVLASSLVFTSMCLVGAMRMRRLKKSGYPLYVIGELAPIAVSAAVLGFNFLGTLAVALAGVFAVLFVILYTTQRKYLIYN